MAINLNVAQENDKIIPEIVSQLNNRNFHINSDILQEALHDKNMQFTDTYVLAEAIYDKCKENIAINCLEDAYWASMSKELRDTDNIRKVIRSHIAEHLELLKAFDEAKLDFSKLVYRDGEKHPAVNERLYIIKKFVSELELMGSDVSVSKIKEIYENITNVLLSQKEVRFKEIGQVPVKTGLIIPEIEKIHDDMVLVTKNFINAHNASIYNCSSLMFCLIKDSWFDGKINVIKGNAVFYGNGSSLIVNNNTFYIDQTFSLYDDNHQYACDRELTPHPRPVLWSRFSKKSSDICDGYLRKTKGCTAYDGIIGAFTPNVQKVSRDCFFYKQNHQKLVQKYSNVISTDNIIKYLHEKIGDFNVNKFATLLFISYVNKNHLSMLVNAALLDLFKGKYESDFADFWVGGKGYIVNNNIPSLTYQKLINIYVEHCSNYTDLSSFYSWKDDIYLSCYPMSHFENNVKQDMGGAHEQQGSLQSAIYWIDGKPKAAIPTYFQEAKITYDWLKYLKKTECYFIKNSLEYGQPLYKFIVDHNKENSKKIEQMYAQCVKDHLYNERLPKNNTTEVRFEQMIYIATKVLNKIDHSIFNVTNVGNISFIDTAKTHTGAAVALLPCISNIFTAVLCAIAVGGIVACTEGWCWDSDNDLSGKKGKVHKIPSKQLKSATNLTTSYLKQTFDYLNKAINNEYKGWEKSVSLERQMDLRLGLLENNNAVYQLLKLIENPVIKGLEACEIIAPNAKDKINKYIQDIRDHKNIDILEQDRRLTREEICKTNNIFLIQEAYRMSNGPKPKSKNGKSKNMACQNALAQQGSQPTKQVKQEVKIFLKEGNTASCGGGRASIDDVILGKDVTAIACENNKPITSVQWKFWKNGIELQSTQELLENGIYKNAIYTAAKGGMYALDNISTNPITFKIWMDGKYQLMFDCAIADLIVEALPVIQPNIKPGKVCLIKETHKKANSADSYAVKLLGGCPLSTYTIDEDQGGIKSLIIKNNQLTNHHQEGMIIETNKDTFNNGVTIGHYQIVKSITVKAYYHNYVSQQKILTKQNFIDSWDKVITPEPSETVNKYTKGHGTLKFQDSPLMILPDCIDGKAVDQIRIDETFINYLVIRQTTQNDADFVPIKTFEWSWSVRAKKTKLNNQDFEWSIQGDVKNQQNVQLSYIAEYTGNTKLFSTNELTQFQSQGSLTNCENELNLW